MSEDQQNSAGGQDFPAPAVRNALLTLEPPEVDEFDIDVRFGEITGGGVTAMPLLPRDAQTDGAGSPSHWWQGSRRHLRHRRQHLPGHLCGTQHLPTDAVWQHLRGDMCGHLPQHLSRHVCQHLR